MGNTIEEVLTKSTNQRIYGQKKFQGSINASELIVSGLINDVNLTELVDHQLKKNNHLQTIKTGIEFQNSLHIRGDLIVKGTYGGAELKNFYTSYSSVLPIAEKMKIFLEAAETINTALQSITFTSFLLIFKGAHHNILCISNLKIYKKNFFNFSKQTKWYTPLKQHVTLIIINT